MTIDYTKYGFIFDMDGTLVDNMRFHTKAWQAMLAENGIENDGHDFLVKTRRKNKPRNYSAIFWKCDRRRIIETRK